MANFYDAWATSYRNTRAWGTVFFLIAMLLLLFIQEKTGPKFLGTEQGKGEVVEIKLSSSQDQATERAYLKIQVDGGIVKAFLSVKPYPKVGDSVPLTVELFDDQTKRYYINQAKLRERSLGLL